MASLYALLRHLQGKQDLAWYCVLVCGCSISGTFILQLFTTLVQNRFFVFGCARASLIYEGNVVCIEITTPTHWRIGGGQYINIWMPGLSIRSFLQSHPFVIAAADQQEPGVKLELLIWPQRGWTSHLQHRALHVDRKSQSYRVVFTGPYGTSAAVHDYGIVVLAATGSGIFAQLPYLQQLVRGYDNFVCRTRRIHLVWQLDQLGTVLFLYP